MEEEKEPNHSPKPSLSDLVEKVAALKQAYYDLSSELFHKQQEFLKNHESLRQLKQQYKEDIDQHVKQVVKQAKAEAHRRHVQEEVEQHKQERKSTITEQQNAIAKQREELQQALLQYRVIRNKVSDLQREVTKEGQEKQKHASQLAEILTGTKYILENQMRKPSQRKTFPTKKEVARTQRELLRCAEAFASDLYAYHTEKLLSFRMQERILMGRCKDAMEKGGRVVGEDLPANFVPPEHDSLESRIANKMFTLPNTELSNRYHDSDNEMGEMLPGEGEGGDHPLPPPLHPRNRRFSILQSGEVARLQSKWAHTSAAKPPTGARKLVEKEEGVVYDPDLFAPYCATDFIRPHLLLENHSQTGERELKMRQLGAMLCHAKGKVIQLHAVKEGLDAFLLKHLAMLCTVLERVQPSLVQGLLKEDKKRGMGMGRGKAHQPPSPPPFQPLHKALLQEIIASAQESQQCSTDIYQQLFAPLKT